MRGGQKGFFCMGMAGITDPDFDRRHRYSRQDFVSWTRSVTHEKGRELQLMKVLLRGQCHDTLLFPFLTLPLTDRDSLVSLDLGPVTFTVKTVK